MSADSQTKYDYIVDAPAMAIGWLAADLVRHA